MNRMDIPIAFMRGILVVKIVLLCKKEFIIGAISYGKLYPKLWTIATKYYNHLLLYRLIFALSVMAS